MSDYIKLPKDANGITWHVGDETALGGTVQNIMLTNDGWLIKITGYASWFCQDELEHKDSLANFANDVRKVVNKAKGRKFSSANEYREAMENLAKRAESLAMEAE